MMCDVYHKPKSTGLFASVGSASSTINISPHKNAFVISCLAIPGGYRYRVRYRSVRNCRASQESGKELLEQVEVIVCQGVS